MARRFFAASKDTTLYQNFPDYNTGFDEILEVGQQTFYTSSYSSSARIVETDNKLSRALIKFDESFLADLLAEQSASAPSILSAQYYLNLRIAHARNLIFNQRIELHPLDIDWTEGTGYLAQEWKNSQDGATWQSASAVTWSSAGGDFTSGSDSLYWEFGKTVSDVRLNVTDQILQWISGSAPNYGWAVKLPDIQESSSIAESNLKFFSSQTHTIHIPTLEVVWNTQIVNTEGSGLNVAPDEYETYIRNLCPCYATGSTARLRFGMRPRYIIKSFNDRFGYGNHYFFPSESFIGIRDEGSRKMVIPFDDGSRISSDGTGSYYDLKIENMFPRRIYRVFVRTQKPWGYQVIDTGATFTIQ